jgi:hypothetical protein
MPMLIDGGGGRRSPANNHSPTTPPTPPPPKRVADAQPKHTGGSADSVERQSQAKKKPLADAATNTQQKVETAAKANQSIAGFERLPPQQRKALRGEIEIARSDAARANADANKAVADELEIARNILSPAYYDDYVAGMERDFDGNPDAQAVARQALKQPAVGSTASTGNTRSADRIEESGQAQVLQEKVDTAERKQATADGANARIAANPNAGMTEYTYAAELNSQASAAWSEVEAEVQRRYDALTPPPASPYLSNSAQIPTAQDIKGLSDQLRAAGSDPHLEEIILRSEADAAHESTQRLIDATKSSGSLDIFLSSSNTNESKITELVSLEAASRARLSDDPLKALAEGVPSFNFSVAASASVQRAIETGLANAKSVLAADNPSAWDAYGTSGAAAASAEIRRQVETASSPEERDRILADSAPLLKQINIDLAETSKSADESESQYQGRPAFDATIDNLSAIATVVQGTPAGDQFVESMQDQMVDAITRNGNVGRYDEALGLAVKNGSGATLAAGVIDGLSQSGNKDNVVRAGDILENVSKGFDALEKRLDETQKRVDEADAELAAALPYANLLPADERDQAIADFYAQHADIYAERDKVLDRLLGDADIVNNLITSSGNKLSTGSERGKEAVERSQKEISEILADPETLRAISASDVATERIAASLESGKPSIFSVANLQAAAATAKDPAAVRDAWLDAIFHGVGASAAAMRESGDSEGADQALSRLSYYAPLAGSSTEAQNSYREGVDALRSIVTAPNADQALVGAETLGNVLDQAEKGVADAAFTNRFESVGFGLTVASVGLRAPEVIANGDLNSRLGLTVDTADAMLQVYTGLRGGEKLGVKAFGKLLGAAELILDIKSFPTDGDGVEKGLATAAIIGQIGALVAIPGAGWVAGIAGVSLVVYQALDDDKDNPVARDMLIAGGFDEDLAQALTKFDVNGYSGAFAIREGIAAKLGLTSEQAQTAAGQEAIYAYLKQLTPGQAEAFAKAAQGLEPQRVDEVGGGVLGETAAEKEARFERLDPDGDGVVLRESSRGDVEAIDQFISNHGQPWSTDTIPTPESIEGLVRWIDAYRVKNGYDSGFPEPSSAVIDAVETAHEGT